MKIASILMVLWLAGLVCGYSMSGLIHLLLAGAVVMLAFKIFSGPKHA